MASWTSAVKGVPAPAAKPKPEIQMPKTSNTLPAIQRVQEHQKNPNAGMSATQAMPQFVPQGAPGMSYDDALGRANAQLDPSFGRAVEGVKSQQRADTLNAGQIASNRGGAHSGLAADQINKVGIAAANNIANLEANRASTAAQMAQAMVDRSEDRADRLRQQAFAEYMGQNQLGLSAAGLTGNYNGQRTLAGQDSDWGRTIDEANLTGDYKGRRTLVGQNADWGRTVDTANLTGVFNGQQTLAGQAQGLANKQANLNAALSVGAATGKAITPQGDWSGLFRQAANQNTPLNLAGQGQQMDQMQVMAGLTGYLPNGQKTNALQQQELQNLWQVADATGTIPDSLADLYGIPRGSQTMQAKQFAFNQSIQWSQENRLQDQFESGVDSDLFNYMNKQSGANSNAPTASSISQNINRSISAMGKNFNVASPEGRKQIEGMIVTQTQDPRVAVQLYNMYGIPVPKELQNEYEQSLKVNQ
ncbi:hypothetical protein [Paenibacillus spongiae]|uniref:Tail fiber domain-containing protein n=1 Tax=Paenibacillus spongiae TaxID=2909671 RepID=A0ABY5SB94_9BACL|nr:hypothetical protein [Paenibacillus spongiae]UVI31221.1 hypothetical protein L1F29_05085 [Paenibacillus spongiae]